MCQAESRENHNQKKLIEKNMTKVKTQAIPMPPAREPKGERDQLRQAVKQDNKQTGASIASANLFERYTPPIPEWFPENSENYIRDGFMPQRGR